MRKLLYKKPGGKKKSKYGRGGNYARDIPPADTVGALIELLKQLPPALPISPSDEGIKLVWFNAGLDDEHLAFEENDGAFDE